MKALEQLKVSGKRVFLRVDLNVPLTSGGAVADDTRIQAILPSLSHVLNQGGKAILASHLGRPKGEPKPEFSLKPVAEYLQQTMEMSIPLAPDCIGESVRSMTEGMKDGQAILLENLRFHPGEQKNDPEFSKQLASMAEIYVNDAFAVSHRAHASVHGITRFVSECAAGFQLKKELDYYHRAMGDPARPLTVIIGGAKVSTKIGVLEYVIPKIDRLIIGGAMANTFLKSQGKEVGRSLVEDDHLETARGLMELADRHGVRVALPVDGVVAPGLDHPEPVRTVDIEQVPPETLILDAGKETVKLYEELLADSATVVWNGPLGAFETPPFHKATFAIAEYLSRCDALTIIGGGDSASAVKQAGVADQMSYISTGGGAFLEMLEGKTLPAVAALEECGSES